MAHEQILAALQKLDVNNDGHWTQDGLPRLETVRLFAGNQALTRDNITAASPEFTRLHAYNAQQAAQGAPATTAAPTPEKQPGAQETPPAAPPLADPVPPAAAELAPIATLEFNTPEPEARFEDLTKQEQLEIVEAELAELDKYLVTAQKHKRQLQQQKDDLVLAIDKEAPKHSNQHDIQAYLASQNKLLEQRAQQIANVKKVERELGARLTDLVPKRAPIDAAMMRRTGYGRKRPGT
jgi:hypothetical protein